jgi:hypothetical protein
MKVKLPKYNKADERNAEVRIDHWDTWSFDHTLATIVLPALLQLKNTKQGVPAEFGDVGGANYDLQSSFDFYEETNNDAFDESCKRWDTILDKMIWSFSQLLDGSWEEKYHHGEQPDFYTVESDHSYTDPVTGKVEKTFEMRDRNKGKHYTDMAGLEEHQKRIDEGLELFGKYYRHLWD